MASVDFKSRLIAFSDSPLQKIIFVMVAFCLLVLPGAAALWAGLSEQLVLPVLLGSVPILLVLSLWAKQFVEHSLLKPGEETFLTDEQLSSRETKYPVVWDLGRPRTGAPGMIAVVPAYNEERSIGRRVGALKKFVEDVVVVDAQSADRTADLAHLSGATVVKLWTRLDRMNKPSFVQAINCGVEFALSPFPWVQATSLLLLGSRVPSDFHLEALMRASLEHPLVVVSSPRPVGEYIIRRFLSRVRLKLFAALVGFPMTDSVSAVILRADLAQRVFPISLQTWEGVALQISVGARRLGIKPFLFHIDEPIDVEPTKTSAKTGAHDTRDITFVDVVRLDLGLAPKRRYRRESG